MNQLDLRDRTAIVTGGAAGIGFAIAQRLVASGCRVALWDRDSAALAKAAASLGGPSAVRGEADLGTRGIIPGYRRCVLIA